jgi:hypothetical protein
VPERDFQFLIIRKRFAAEKIEPAEGPDGADGEAVAA